MRTVFAFVALGVGLLGLGACPGPTPPTGDIQFGQYEVTASVRMDECQLGEEVQRGDFGFRARLAADEDGARSWLAVSLPPAYAEQAPIAGDVVDGGMAFTGQQQIQLGACGCVAPVTERFSFALHGEAPAADGGTSDAGADVDGGPVTDAGAEALDGGEAPPVPGLPHPDEVRRVTGLLEYEVATGSGCQARDADAGTGCALPCEFSYDLAGPRR